MLDHPLDAAGGKIRRLGWQVTSRQDLPRQDVHDVRHVRFRLIRKRPRLQVDLQQCIRLLCQLSQAVFGLGHVEPESVDQNVGSVGPVLPVRILQQFPDLGVRTEPRGSPLQLRSVRQFPVMLIAGRQILECRGQDNQREIGSLPARDRQQQAQGRSQHAGDRAGR